MELMNIKKKVKMYTIDGIIIVDSKIKYFLSHNSICKNADEIIQNCSTLSPNANNISRKAL